jgi:hypothetical protein
MTTLAVSEFADRGTGIRSYDWLGAQFEDTGSRTSRFLPASIIYFVHDLRPDAAQSYLIDRAESVTDPNAQKRFIGPGLTQMAQSLSQLANIAGVVIPGLREMAPAERANLRQYYKRIYRKA